jgi:hypothetical protein
MLRPAVNEDGCLHRRKEFIHVFSFLAPVPHKETVHRNMNRRE